MDFDSLNILKNNNTQNNYSSDYSNINSSNNNNTIEKKVSDENIKLNTSDFNIKLDNNKQLKNSDIKEQNDDNQYKGTYNEAVDNAIKIANEKLKELNRQFSYSIHKETNRVMITIKNSDGKVIKEVPSQESLDFFAKLQELSGMLLDEKR